MLSTSQNLAWPGLPLAREKTDSERLSDWSQVTQQRGDRAGIQGFKPRSEDRVWALPILLPTRSQA